MASWRRCPQVSRKQSEFACREWKGFGAERQHGPKPREKTEPLMWPQLSGVESQVQVFLGLPGRGGVSWESPARGMMGLGTGGQKQGDRERAVAAVPPAVER